MEDCSSTVAFGVLTIGVVVVDLYSNRTERLNAHIFLGCIITSVSYFLCTRGYTMVNWGMLVAVIVYLGISAIAINSHKRDSSSTGATSCNECGMPKKHCGCQALIAPVPRPKRCGCNPKKRCGCEEANREPEPWF